MITGKAIDEQNWIIKLGDNLFELTRKTVYYSLYPVFSIIRAALHAIKDCWEDAS